MQKNNSPKSISTSGEQNELLFTIEYCDIIGQCGRDFLGITRKGMVAYETYRRSRNWEFHCKPHKADSRYLKKEKEQLKNHSKPC